MQQVDGLQNFIPTEFFYRYSEAVQKNIDVVLPALASALPYASECEKDRLEYYLNMISSCGSVKYFFECQDCGKSEFVGFCGCKIRFCVPCQQKRGKIFLAKVLTALSDIEYSELAHLTLTLRNMDSFSQMYTELTEAWRKMYNSTKFRKEFKRRFIGGLRSVEFTIGRDCKYHVHMHLLLLKNSSENDFEFLKKSWKEVTDGNGSVYIRRVKSEINAILECTKYVTKTENWLALRNDGKRILDVVNGLYRKRTIECFGVLRGIKFEDDEEFDTWEEKKIAEAICRFCGSRNIDLVKAYSSLNATI